MLRRIITALLSLVVIFGFAAVSFSADKGNSRKGKYLFRKSCRECHQDGAAAKALSPDSKTQAQWTQTFQTDQFKALACSEEWDKRKDKELLDIYTYLHKHAFDSPTPAKCK